MPTFFKRKYKRRYVPVAEVVIGGLIFTLLVAVGVAIVVTTRGKHHPLFELSEEAKADFAKRTTAAPTRLAATPRRLPPIDEPGWEPPNEPQVFTQENLYEKIDGRDEKYIAFRVVRLVFGSYQRTAGDGYADVYWYDMGHPFNAFGIYKAELGQQGRPVDIGREGYVAGSSVFFWKGASYVQVMPSDEDPLYKNVAIKIARAIAEAVSDDGQSLWADDLLPHKNRVKGSLAFEATSVFSLDFLNDVFTAEYEAEGMRSKLFAHRAKSQTEAKRLLDAYASFFEKYGKVLSRRTAEGYELIIGDASGVVDVVFAKGRYLGGVSGAEDARFAAAQAEEFARSLTVQ